MVSSRPSPSGAVTLTSVRSAPLSVDDHGGPTRSARSASPGGRRRPPIAAPHRGRPNRAPSPVVDADGERVEGDVAIGPRRRRGRQHGEALAGQCGGGVGEQPGPVGGHHGQAERARRPPSAGPRRAPRRRPAAGGTARGRRRAPTAARSSSTAATPAVSSRVTTRRGIFVRPSSRAAPPSSPAGPSVSWSAACTRTTFSSTALRARGLASSHECPPRSTVPSVPIAAHSASKQASGQHVVAVAPQHQHGDLAAAQLGQLGRQIGPPGQRGDLDEGHRVGDHVPQQVLAHGPHGPVALEREELPGDTVRPESHGGRSATGRTSAGPFDAGRVADRVDQHEVADAARGVVGRGGWPPPRRTSGRRRAPAGRGRRPRGSPSPRRRSPPACACRTGRYAGAAEPGERRRVHPAAAVDELTERALVGAVAEPPAVQEHDRQTLAADGVGRAASLHLAPPPLQSGRAVGASATSSATPSPAQPRPPTVVDGHVSVNGA